MFLKVHNAGAEQMVDCCRRPDQPHKIPEF